MHTTGELHKHFLIFVAFGSLKAKEFHTVIAEYRDFTYSFFYAYPGHL
jgi:hypothetical protein